MKILVFDTCFNKSYLVLQEDNNIIADEIIESNETNYHSVYLIPKIRDIFSKNNLLLKDIDAIGVNIGPGSFTGIRAGITIARVFAQQYNIKLVGVSSLEILSKLNNTPQKTVVVLDARKNNVYKAEFINGKEILQPMITEKENFIKNIDDNEVIITDSALYEDIKKVNKKTINFEEHDNNLGIYLSDIVYTKLNDTKTEYNWAKVKPLYLQRPSITLAKAVKNV